MITERIKRVKNLNEHKILIVDDDPFLLKLMHKALAFGGFLNIFTAENGKDCINLLGIPFDENKTSSIERQDIDLVICDIVLPDTNGFDLCQKIKKDRPNVALVFISGYDIQDINSKIITSGADDFLIKPFNTNELITRIKMIFERRNKLFEQSRPDEIQPVIKLRKSYGLPYIGDRIGDYVIVDFLGWGQTTVIYKVIDSSSNTLVALKMLTRNASEIPEALKRFMNEISILASVENSNIIRYIDRGIIGECPYLIMEYIDGMDLEEFLITRGKISEEDFLRIAYDIACAIDAIHEKKIIHRDIKLKNILYEFKTAKVKISDFGIAHQPESLNITKDGYVLGTPLYMAPEALFGEEADFKSDIYSYGATMYHLVTGTPPFTAPNSIKLGEKIRNGVPASIKSLRNDLKIDWDSLIIDKCLARNPADRADSMRQILKIISAYGYKK